MLNDKIQLINDLKEALSQESCLPKEAFIKLGTGAAPSLNYNVPQSTSFTMYAANYIKGIADGAFQDHCFRKRKGDYFDLIKTKDRAELQGLFAQSIQLQQTDDTLISGSLFRRHLNTENSDLLGASLLLGDESPAGPTGPTIPVDPVDPENPPVETPPLIQDNTNGVNEIQLANIAQQNLQPLMIESMGGYKTRMALLAEPERPDPYFMVIEEYTTSAFLGDYGAGKTLNTFSLLPGEKTTISVKTFSDRTSTKSYAENVLDSFSEASTDELEHNIENESGSSESTTSSTSSTVSASKSKNISANIGGAIKKIINFGVSGGKQSGSASSTTNSSSATRSSNVRSLNTALDKHVASSNSNRQIQINTTTNESVHEGEEDSTVRELVNLNKSRVLNFVFRELLQQYITITYLSNIRFVFCNGYKDSIQIVDLEELDKLLEDNINENYVNEVRKKLLKNYCNVVNYNDEAIEFVEKKDFHVGHCVGFDETESFYRIKKDISDSYLVNPNTNFSLSVPGPILNVSNYTLKTESLVVDALLGQGEALDCYGMKTQDAAAIAEQLKNLQLVQKMELVEAIDDPKERADAYKKIFGECCSTPQTQIIH